MTVSLFNKIYIFNTFLDFPNCAFCSLSLDVAFPEIIKNVTMESHVFQPNASTWETRF